MALHFRPNLDAELENLCCFCEELADELNISYEYSRMKEVIRLEPFAAAVVHRKEHDLRAHVQGLSLLNSL